MHGSATWNKAGVGIRVMLSQGPSSREGSKPLLCVPLNVSAPWTALSEHCLVAHQLLQGGSWWTAFSSAPG